MVVSRGCLPQGLLYAEKTHPRYLPDLILSF